MDLSNTIPVFIMLAAALLALGGLAFTSQLFGADSRELGTRDGRPVRWI